ncbi:MAG: hypothetical protein IPJ58_14925 [Ardenticatenia bacterium]|nr:hypothetical protein [Ardenticatenia bacterium]
MRLEALESTLDKIAEKQTGLGQPGKPNLYTPAVAGGLQKLVAACAEEAVALKTIGDVQGDASKVAALVPSLADAVAVSCGEADRILKLGGSPTGRDQLKIRPTGDLAAENAWVFAAIRQRATEMIEDSD